MSKKIDYATLPAEEWQKLRDEFMARHQDMPSPKPIECLNLIMRREFAEQILNGTKIIEFRAASEHYYQRIVDKEVINYLESHDDITEDEEREFVPILRPVKKIHFHNYNNSWFLDVECNLVDIIAVIKSNVEWLQETYNCHELDELYNDLEKTHAIERPIFLIFECGKVIDTNLNN